MNLLSFGEPVYIYVPSEALNLSLPSCPESLFRWLSEGISHHPAKRLDGSLVTKSGGYEWMYRTYIELRKENFDVTLTADMPDSGIVISHSDFLVKKIAPTKSRYIVEVKPDKRLACQNANYAIVQCHADPIRSILPRLAIPSSVIWFWPQAGIKPRDQSRLLRFENIGYLGFPAQLFCSDDLIRKVLKQFGLQWLPKYEMNQWGSYQDLDAIVAVRPKIPRDKLSTHFYQDRRRKPPNKLINAWIGGVPAIVSPEPSFSRIVTSRHDCLYADDIRSVITSITRLQASDSLRNAMMCRAASQAKRFSTEYYLKRWVNIIAEEIVPRYRQWRDAHPLLRKILLTRTDARLRVASRATI